MNVVDLTEPCMHNACMVTLTVRNVPSDVHASLVAKAANAGQSLQQFLVCELEKLASRPSMADLLQSVEGSELGDFGFDFARGALEQDRIE